MPGDAVRLLLPPEPAPEHRERAHPKGDGYLPELADVEAPLPGLDVGEYRVLAHRSRAASSRWVRRAVARCALSTAIRARWSRVRNVLANPRRSNV